MSDERARALRFVVGQRGGPRSSSWKAWAQAGSFYIAPREMKGALKVSLHPPNERFPDGRFVFGFTQEFLNTGVEMEPPDHPRWEPFDPLPLHGGITRVCTVQVPHEVVNVVDPLRGAHKHVWVPPPASGLARQLVFLLLAEGVDDAGSAAARADYLGEVHNSRGDRLIVLHNEQALAQRPRITCDMGPTAKSADYAKVRAVAMGLLTADNSCVMTEVAGEPLSALTAHR